MTLPELLVQSGMDFHDWAVAIGFRREKLSKISKMVDGFIPTPDGVTADALQLLSDIEWFRAFVDANPELKNIHYKVCKLVLDGNE